MAPKSALLVDFAWCKKILAGEKTWEIRNKHCKKRERVALACTSKTSPTGTCLILGEVDITDSFPVAKKRGMFVSAPQDPQNFMFLRKNIKKHQIHRLWDFPILKSYETTYAWVMANPTKHDEPKELTVKKGCVVWATIG